MEVQTENGGPSLGANPRVLGDRRHQHLIPSWQDIVVLELNYVTVSSIKPVLKLLTEDDLKTSDKDTILTSDIKRKMCSVLEEKYRPAALQNTLAKSCLLDPRYRGKNFDDDAEEETKCALEGALPVRQLPPNQSPWRRQRCHQRQKKKTCWSHGQARLQPSRREPEPTWSSLPTCRRNPSTLMKTSWHGGATNWRDFPCSPQSHSSTSAPSERVFSVVGNVITPLRSSVKPHKVNMLVWPSYKSSSFLCMCECEIVAPGESHFVCLI